MAKIVERVQTGVRIETRTLKVLKGLAEYLNLSLGELLEGIILHSFEGRSPFTRKTLDQIEKLKSVYAHTLTAAESHKLSEVSTKGDR